MSLAEALPCSPCSVSLMYALTFARLPVRRFVSDVWLNVPSPPTDSAMLASSACVTSVSGRSEIPPGLCAANSTSSRLKSLGLSRTLAPFDNRHSRMPVSGSLDSETILPGVGIDARSGASDVESTYAVSDALSGRSYTASISSRVGSLISGLSGAATMATRSCLGNEARASAFSSSRVTVGAKRCASFCSSAMLRIGVSLSALETYWPAKALELVLSRSA